MANVYSEGAPSSSLSLNGDAYIRYILPFVCLNEMDDSVLDIFAAYV